MYLTLIALGSHFAPHSAWAVKIDMSVSPYHSSAVSDCFGDCPLGLEFSLKPCRISSKARFWARCKYCVSIEAPGVRGRSEEVDCSS